MDSGTPDTVKRKLAAILSADAVGYSRLMAQAEAETLKTLNAHRDLMGGLVRQHGGRIVNAVGDNLLAEFPSVMDATACAIAIQDALAERGEDLPPESKMEFRIGVHLGDVMIDGDDIYGDGVNIAARLESLAEPGGICISGNVYDQIRRKLSHAYEDLGEQRLKNIADPVRVYRLRCGSDEGLNAAVKLTVPGFAGRPAIAVLAFDNLSGDSDQEYFADGIAEDLITRLSAFRLFPVISRNSSFTYKGAAVDVKQVSRQLGVHYVVEGSVQRAGDRVRISAQLIDATTGHHIWAERYDRELRDVFTLQDEITEAIVGSINPELLRFEEERALRKAPGSLDAWDCIAQGYWHVWQFARENNSIARSLFERATKLDPYSAAAFVGLGMSHYNDTQFQWTESLPHAAAAMTQAAQKSVALDDKNPLGQVLVGWAYSLTGQRDEMITAFELALEIDPSFSEAYRSLGIALAWTGRPQEAIANIEKSLRLSPRDPLIFLFFLAMSIGHFATERYEQTADWARRAIKRRPDFPAAYRYLAASYAHLDRVDEARNILQEMFRRNPEFTLAADRVVLSTVDSAFVERLFSGLRKAGLEEG